MKSESVSESLGKYREIFQKINVMVVVHDIQGNIIEVNECMVNSLEYSESEIKSLNVTELFNENDRSRYREFIQSTVIQGSSTLEFSLKKKNADVFPANVSSNSIQINGNKLLLCVMDEISELKEVERELREKNLFIDSIIENIPNMIFVKDAKELRFVRFNKAGEELLGYSREEMLGKNDYDFFPKEEADFFTKKDRAVLNSRKLLDISEEEIHTRNKGVRTLHTKKITINAENGDPKYLLGISEDITERKQAENMLKENEEYYRSVVENAHDLIIESDNTGSYIYVSPNHKTILGYEPDELVGTSIFDNIHPNDIKDIYAEFTRAMISQSTGRGIFRYKHKSGEWRWFECNGKPIKTPSGQVRIILHSRDITERKRAEEQIHKSLKEKESLLREIHHRVKNNLQVISSLLSLQSDYAKGIDSSKLFDESQNRISTIALIHEHLYQSEDLAEINIGQYIGDLTNNLLTVYGDEGNNVSVKFNTDDLTVDIDTAIPCGLIINELFSNCLKHAFVPQNGGKKTEKPKDLISVGFNSNNSGSLVLLVKDNGIGLPEGLDYKDTESLGLQLVCMLTEQLGGVIEVGNSVGCEFRITFPISSR
jgi:PAS domain S-box-containing protein